MSKIDEALAHAVGQVRPPPVETLPQWIERVVRLPEGSLGACAKVVGQPSVYPYLSKRLSISCGGCELD